MYEYILVERRGRVVLITLNRPRALNALSLALLEELDRALADCDADREVGCVVIAGSERAFAAGADVREMASCSYPDTYLDDIFAVGERITTRRKPKIAAVAGVALGGGCELAMMCDMIFAADTAKFAQPEIRLGITPGMGGTQRLARLIGRTKAMDLCLTGRTIDAAEAERWGLVSRVVPADTLLDAAMEAAKTIAGMSLPAAMLVKEAVNRADETGLAEGVRFERRVFQGLFATADQKEGMAAFAEKRPPSFRNR